MNARSEQSDDFHVIGLSKPLSIGLVANGQLCPGSPAAPGRAARPVGPCGGPRPPPGLRPPPRGRFAGGKPPLAAPPALVYRQAPEVGGQAPSLTTPSLQNGERGPLFRVRKRRFPARCADGISAPGLRPHSDSRAPLATLADVPVRRRLPQSAPPTPALRHYPKKRRRVGRASVLLYRPPAWLDASCAKVI